MAFIYDFDSELPFTIDRLLFDVPAEDFRPSHFIHDCLRRVRLREGQQHAQQGWLSRQHEGIPFAVSSTADVDDYCFVKNPFDGVRFLSFYCCYALLYIVISSRCSCFRM